MMHRVLFATAIALLASATADADRVRQVKYVGIHPIAKSEGGGTCYIEAPHVHVYAADKVQYRDHRGQNFFVGDPVAYGYEGPKYTYKGHHPIHVHAVVDDEDPDVEYCYLDGPHYHSFAPPDGSDVKVVGGAYFYVGTPPKAYVTARPQMVQINAMYKLLVYTRPVVTVAAPVGWIGARVDITAPTVVVPAPGVRVDIGVRTPTVIIDHHHHHKHKKLKYKKHKKWK